MTFLEAAKLDGANSWKFFIDFLIPLSKTMITSGIYLYVCLWIQSIFMALDNDHI